MYLRKSRAVDGLSPEEILRRHRETLTEFASRNGIRVVEVFQEIKSGAKLYDRPEMLRLLDAVESGRFQAVLCMDIDRLSRDEMRERGRILATFKEADVVIITPGKTYDLSKEADELMTELRGLFANYEYKKILERTRRGMLRAAKEGCHLSYAPYGYRKRVVDRKHTLEIYEPEAAFVRLAFELYGGGMGCNLIAERLTELGARPRRASVFTRVTILKMIKNPVYVGKIVYNQEKWTRKNGKITVKIRPENEWISVEGLHPPIIDAETWEKAQSVLKSRWRPAYFDGSVQSPLAGLVRCRHCGGRMQRRAIDGRYYLYCLKRGCCMSSRFADVEAAVVRQLRELAFEMERSPDETYFHAISAAEARLSEVRNALEVENRKKARLCDFLEDGTYSPEMFRERMEKVTTAISALKRRESEAVAEIDMLSGRDVERCVGEIKALLDVYNEADAQTRNALLRGIVDIIWYERPKGSAEFVLDIFLR